MAYKHIVFKYGYSVRHQGYKTHEIVELLHLKGDGEKHTEYVIANHINKLVAYFCNSDKANLEGLNYLDTVTDSKAKIFVKQYFNYIVLQTELLLTKMDRGEIDITHDFYLKKFQLSKPKLDFDYILFDEGQDASPAMLDVFFNQKATKVIVGDTHQQIYGWRFAINSLEKADFEIYHLSKSFRFSQDIANLAIAVLNFKKHLNIHKPFAIIGCGANKEIKTKAVIARTNLGLLLKAIEYVTETKKLKHIYFEGNINSYTYADDGTSLYDVLNLSNGKYKLIKDKLIRSMKDLDELDEYIKKTEDVQLGMMVEIVREYGNKIPIIIKEIKDKHVENDDKEKAEMIFSTVHRCKGMEYDAIQLANDFITEDKLESNQNDKKGKDKNTAKLIEEINLLYVAVTRTKNSVHIPETITPVDFPISPQIHVMKMEMVSAQEENAREEKSWSNGSNIIEIEKKTYSVDQIRTKHKDAYRPWTKELDDELTLMYCEGINTKDLSKHFRRTKGSIRSRINKLELKELHS